MLDSRSRLGIDVESVIYEVDLYIQHSSETLSSQPPSTPQVPSSAPPATMRALPCHA